MQTLKIEIFVILLILVMSFLSAAQLEKAGFQASGLTCSMCSNAISKALKTVPFIERISTGLNKKKFEITFKKNTAVDFDAI